MINMLPKGALFGVMMLKGAVIIEKILSDKDPICSSASPKRPRDLRQNMTAPFFEPAQNREGGN